MKKLRVGFFSLSSCEGCLMTVLSLGEELLDLAKVLEIKECRALGLVKQTYLDVAFVEGAVSSIEDEEELLDIRRRSRVLVALGDCACTGGKFYVKDFENKEEVNLPRSRAFRSDPLSKYVTVDVEIRGCPINIEEFVKAVKDIALNKIHELPNYNVCAECILHNTRCLLDGGILCLGPITRAGCSAKCPSLNSPCTGCRGIYEDANLEAFIDLLKEKKIPIPPYIFHLKELVEEAKRK